MPELGEIARGQDIGYASRGSHIWQACVICGKERWVPLLRGEPANKRCHKCGTAQGTLRGAQHYNWKGGRRQGRDGYIELWVSPSDPYHSMLTKHGHISEHRYVMARHLGRCLASSEEVHHKNGIRNDNRIENLELISKANHSMYNRLCANCELRKEIRLLRWQVKELTEALQVRLREI